MDLPLECCYRENNTFKFRALLWPFPVGLDLLWQLFFINKKVTQYALLYAQKKVQPQNVNILFGRVSLAASKSEEPTTA
jgi:hypothetical protein